MKKIILVLAALALTAFTAKAQFYAGGSVALSLNVANGGTGSGFGIAPELGYNINDNMAVGLSVGIAPSSIKQEGTVTFKETVISFDPYFRYFFANLGPARLFADANFNFTTTSTGVTAPYATTNTWGIGIRPGIALPVGSGFSLVAHLGGIGYYAEAFTVGLNNGSAFGVFYAF